LLGLLVGCVGVGVVVGAIEGFLTYELFSLRFLFPMILILSVGGFASYWVGRARLRVPLLAAIIGLLGGVAGELAIHRTGYELFRTEVTRRLRAEDPAADAEAQLQAELRRRTGSDGWLGFVKFVARVGMTREALGGGTKVQISGISLYSEWGFEVVLVALGATVLGFWRARQPFCDRCGRWYDLRERIITGSPRPRDWRAVVAALAAGEGAGALALRGQPGTDAYALYALLRCGGCEEHEPILTVRTVKITIDRGERHENETQRYARPIPPALASALLALGRLEEPLTSSAADRW
jgi:hypothetical protein